MCFSAFMPQCVCSCSRKKEEERRACCVLTSTARLEEDQIVSGLTRLFKSLHSGTFKINQEAFFDVLCRRSVSCYAEVYLGPCLPFPIADSHTHVPVCVCVMHLPAVVGFFCPFSLPPFLGSSACGAQNGTDTSHSTHSSAPHPCYINHVIYYLLC